MLLIEQQAGLQELNLLGRVLGGPQAVDHVAGLVEVAGLEVLDRQVPEDVHVVLRRLQPFLQFLHRALGIARTHVDVGLGQVEGRIARVQFLAFGDVRAGTLAVSGHQLGLGGQEKAVAIVRRQPQRLFGLRGGQLGLFRGLIGVGDAADLPQQVSRIRQVRLVRLGILPHHLPHVLVGLLGQVQPFPQEPGQVRVRIQLFRRQFDRLAE